MTAYLQAAAEDSNRDVIAAAVEDTLEAMAQKTSLEHRGNVADDRV